MCDFLQESRVSGPFWLKKNIDFLHFLQQYRVSGLFWQGASVMKYENLMKASRFRPTSARQETLTKTMILLTATCFLICYHNIEQLTD